MRNGLQYSVDGFVALVTKMRAGKTLVVEGVSDKLVIGVLRSSIGDTGQASRVEVDHVGQVKAEGRGNKELVRELVRRAAVSRVLGLVDREYDGVAWSVAPLEANPRPSPRAGVFETPGHSLENCFFGEGVLCGALRVVFGDLVPPELLSELVAALQWVLPCAAAASLALVEASALSRSGGLPAVGCWDLAKRDLALSALVDSLKARHVPDGALATFASSYATVRPIVLAAPTAVVRRVVHGHFGLDSILSAWAAILAARGVSKVVCDTVAGGRRDELYRGLAGEWARLLELPDSQARPDEPQGLREWLVARASNQ